MSEHPDSFGYDEEEIAEIRLKTARKRKRLKTLIQQEQEQIDLEFEDYDGE